MGRLVHKVVGGFAVAALATLTACGGSSGPAAPSSAAPTSGPVGHSPAGGSTAGAGGAPTGGPPGSGSSGRNGGSSGGGLITGPGGAGLPPEGGGPSGPVIAPDPALVVRLTVRWYSAVSSPDGRTLTVYLAIGVGPCDRLARVATVETARTVTITLALGGPRGTNCNVIVPAVAIPVRTHVRLAAPLDGRRIVDGAP